LIIAIQGLKGVSIFFGNGLASSVKNNRIKKKIETPIDSYFV
jgi:hypothetical protein